ncbi:MAG: hypothetical protein KDE58_42520 [Caldilineaceae bacterium]|nr:hypothetical protein [Caldilineaceae bacterium]
MSHNDGDAAGVVASFCIFLLLLYFAFLITVIVLASVALFVIGWYVTYLLVNRLNLVTGGLLVSEHGGLVVTLAGLLWTGIFWLLVPWQRIQPLLADWPWAAQSPWLIPVVGGILGLCWGLLVLFGMENEPAGDKLDMAGMLAADDVLIDTSLLQEGVILGEDD